MDGEDYLSRDLIFVIVGTGRDTEFGIHVLGTGSCGTRPLAYDICHYFLKFPNSLLTFQNIILEYT